MAELERDDVFCRLVKVDVASHSPQMDPLAQELSADLVGLAPGEARVPIWSTVLGRRAEGHEFDAAYWGRNLRQTVRFTDAVSQLLEDGVSIFVELGPHPILLQSVQQTAQSLGHEAITVACGRARGGRSGCGPHRTRPIVGSGVSGRMGTGDARTWTYRSAAALPVAARTILGRGRGDRSGITRGASHSTA